MAAGLAILAVAGCSRLGFTNRVLLRVPSPDGQMAAVCQEIPVLDGPDFALRLERSDGTVLRRFVDVEWALRNPTVQTHSWTWREVSLSTERRLLLGKGLRFTTGMQVALQLCLYRLEVVRHTGILECGEPSVPRLLDIPQPIVMGPPTRTAGG